jgi:hypothetical protein
LARRGSSYSPPVPGTRLPRLLGLGELRLPILLGEAVSARLQAGAPAVVYDRRLRFWLDVHSRNVPAVRLYQAAGFQVRSTAAASGEADMTYLRTSLELDGA